MRTLSNSGSCSAFSPQLETPPALAHRSSELAQKGGEILSNPSDSQFASLCQPIARGGAVSCDGKMLWTRVGRPR